MSAMRKMLGGLSLLLLGCDPAAQPATTIISRIAIAPTSTVLAADTSLQYLYDFMRDVVADQHLMRTQAVDPTPLESLYASESDTLFLPALRSDRHMYKALADSLMYDNSLLILRCLTKVDVDTMLSQKQRFTSFQWHRGRLGFGPAKGENIYRFSGPLFSKDKTRVLLAIEDLCPGLCGTGKTIVFVKEQGRWKSKASSLPWYH